MAWACTAGISHPDLRCLRLWSTESRADHGLENFGDSLYPYERNGRHVGTRTPDLYQEFIRASVLLSLLQLRVLRLGFLQDGDVGVSVFPEREEILVAGGDLGLSGT
jgi:hypothetical protein